MKRAQPPRVMQGLQLVGTEGIPASLMIDRMMATQFSCKTTAGASWSGRRAEFSPREG